MKNKFIIPLSAAYIVSLICMLSVVIGVSSEIVTDPAWDFMGQIFMLMNFCSGTMAALIILLRLDWIE